MIAGLMETRELTGTAARCPGCGSSHTAWVSAARRDNLLCKTCGACWRPAAGHAERISVRQCPGCSLRRICTAAEG